MAIYEDLTLSKQAFAGDSERDLLSGLIRDLITEQHKSWLEVGAGDGTNLKFNLEGIPHKSAITITALDPDLRIKSDIDGVVVEPQKCTIEEFTPREKFDFINIRHSAYYFDKPRHQLILLNELMSSHGLMAVTLWTEDCCLFDLHKIIAREVSAAPSDLVAEAVQSDLIANGLRLCAARVAYGELDMTQMRSSETVADAIINLASRKLDISRLNRKTRNKILAAFFERSRSPRRANYIGMFSKS